MNRLSPFRRLLARTLVVVTSLATISAIPTPGHAEDPIPQVIIEEVAWAGSSLSTADEWIELANIGTAPADVSGWSLHGAGAAPIILPEGTVIAAGETYRVANYPETDEKSALAVSVQLVTTVVALSNSALGIQLMDADGIVVDLAGDTQAPPAGSSSPRATMIRADLGSGDVATSWMTLTVSKGFKTTDDFGAPGVCELCSVGTSETPAESLPEETDDLPLEEATSTGAVTPAEEILPSITTTTADIVEPPQEETAPATTTTDIVESPPETTTSTATIVMVPTIAQTIPPPPPLRIMLNEAMSNPAAGPEWVELLVQDVSATATDRILELWDASGRIFTLAAHTAVSSPGYLLITLTSARLNNGGDALSLREPNGTILDTTTIPALEDGVSWARDGVTGTWRETTLPTPGMGNRFPEPVITPPPMLTPTPPPLSTPPITTPTQTLPTVTTASPSKETATKKAETLKTPAPKKAVPKTEKNISTPKQKSENKTVATSLLSLTASMTKTPLVNARVRLVGTVGSVPKLLGATHAFILLGEDGRAAIVYLPKFLNTPTFGSTVRAMGTLTSTEKQLELRMKTSDVWMTIATSTPPKPRTVDLLAPGTEDAWGLVSATGTVKTVAATSFVIDVDAVDVTVSAPAVTGYRTKRLVPGDTVHVTGLIDPRKAVPTILVRAPNDVELTSHAPDTVKPVAATAKTKSDSLPDWTPFGAAAGAVAAAGGFQRLRAILKRRRLEAMAAEGSSA